MTEPLKLGIAGLGTVGSALGNFLDERADMLAQICGRAIRVTDVTARDRNKDRGFPLDDVTWHESADALAENGEIDVYVELMGGDGDPALSSVKLALSRGIHVVTEPV